MFPAVKVVEVPVEALRDVDPELLSLVNVNTPRTSPRRARRAAAPSRRASRSSQVAERAGRGAALASAPITVYMNDVEVATMQATPDDLEELAVGFLVSEGLLTDRDALDVGRPPTTSAASSTSSPAEAVPDDLVYKTRYITSGCGKGVTFSSVGHARGLEQRRRRPRRSTSDELYALDAASWHAARLRYRDTGGMHACGLARDGELVARARGRRPAQRARQAARPGVARPRPDRRTRVLLSTGRISYEMAVKAAKARVPVVVSRTAVTDLAAEIADELGITLVGYARGGRMVVYTHPERVRRSRKRSA